jgi:hypothetical protein
MSALKTRRSGVDSSSVVRGLLVLASLSLLPATARGGLKVYDKDDMSLELGMRLQPRAEYDRYVVPGGTDGQRDFMIRRARLKANGKIQGVSYGFEWKIDGTDQIGATASAAVENAWFQYPMTPALQARAGLYDAPFSRDLLVSDSKQLAVDRGQVSAVPSGLGLVDNVVGLEVLGQMHSGREQCAVGVFDNRTIAGKLQDVPMVAGRVDLNLGSTKDVFQDAHFGADRWYSIGLNGSYQGSIENAAGADDSTNAAAGIDGMVDLPLGTGRLFVRGELNAIRTEWHGGPRENNSTIKMIGAGYLVAKQRLQPFVRFDQVRGDALLGGVRRDITYVGANFYQKGHNLKIQGDVRFQSSTEDSVDGARLQAQIDF